MHTLSVSFTVLDSERLPDGVTDEQVVAFIHDVLYLELHRINRINPFLFAVPPEIT